MICLSQNDAFVIGCKRYNMSRVIFFFAAILFGVQALYSQEERNCLTKPIEETLCLSLEDLSSQYDAFLLDAYGVFWGSSDVGILPGAAEAMAYLVSHGKEVGILSNSTQPAKKEEDKLQKHGIYKGIHYHFLLTSGEVAKHLLLQEDLPFPTPRNTYQLFGSIHPRFGSHLQLFEGTKYKEVENLEDADFIYISIPHIDGIDQEDPEVFRDKVQAIKSQIPVLCVNPDRFAMEGLPPRPVVRQGSIAKMFSENNAAVYLMGKPSTIIYHAAIEKFSSGIQKRKILMIGDTPETDIRGAHASGLDAALVTKTGVMASQFLQEPIHQVLHHLPSSDKPEFLIERLSLKGVFY
jgi:HAD superfamily hydrolase (TIGR01459 family)